MPGDWATEAAIGHQLEALEAAWRANNVDEMLASFEDQTCSVIRRTDVEGGRRSRAIARTKPELRQAWTSPATSRRFSGGCSQSDAMGYVVDSIKQSQRSLTADCERSPPGQL